MVLKVGKNFGILSTNISLSLAAFNLAAMGRKGREIPSSLET